VHQYPTEGDIGVSIFVPTTVHLNKAGDDRINFSNNSWHFPITRALHRASQNGNSRGSLFPPTQFVLLNPNLDPVSHALVWFSTDKLTSLVFSRDSDEVCGTQFVLDVIAKIDTNLKPHST
jgi:hypothetical protein